MSHLPGAWGSFTDQSFSYSGTSARRLSPRVEPEFAADPCGQAARPDVVAPRLQPVQLVHDPSGLFGSAKPSTAPAQPAQLSGGPDALRSRPQRRKAPGGLRHTPRKAAPSTKPVTALAAKLAAATAAAEEVTRAMAGEEAVVAFAEARPLLSLPTLCMVVGTAKR